MLTVDVPYFCDGTIQVPASLANCQAAWQDSRATNPANQEPPNLQDLEANVG